MFIPNHEVYDIISHGVYSYMYLLGFGNAQLIEF